MTQVDASTTSEAAPTDAATVAWLGMRRLVLDLNERRAAVAASLGMSFIRAKALLRLAEAPLTMSELALVLSTDAPYTTLVVNDLEERGLVERRIDLTDRRRKIVTATPAGRTTAEAAEAILSEPPRAIRELSPKDLGHLERIIASLVEGK